MTSSDAQAARSAGFCFRTRTPESTLEAGRLLGALWPAEGGVLALIGGLGAGKTVFVRGLAGGLGVPAAEVASPTFVIANFHRGAAGRPALVHADLYRLESPAELEAAGLLDWLEPGNLLAAEWADRLPGALGAERLELTLERSESGAERRLRAQAFGRVAESVAGRWQEALGSSDGVEELE